MNEFPGELQQLFKSYGEFHSDVEPSPNFTPGVWAKIEARRSPVFTIRRMARFLVAGAMATALVMGVLMVPLAEHRKPAGHYADIVAHEDTRADQEYASSLRLLNPEGPQQ
jgi:hypothetical protein